MPTPEISFEMNFEDAQQSEADKKLLVIFYKRAEKNETKSAEAGRPIFDEFDAVKILTPGSKDTYTGDASPDYQQRFPTQWARYKAGQSQDMAGTPLSLLPWLGMGQVAELNAVGCHTVEHLAGMSDALSQKFMGHHGMKQRAQQYLDAAKGNAPLLKMEAELQKRDEQMAEMKSTIDALSAQLKAAAQKTPVKT
jgi:Skp family chaperone for outer membrane proteins